MYIFKILFFCYFSFVLYGQENSSLTIWDTFFSYSSDELQALKDLPISKEELNQQALEAIDPMIYELSDKPLPDGLGSRLIAYLYVAQRDFALLSHQISQQWVGNINLLTQKIMQLITDFRPSNFVQVDSYSSRITDIVFNKIEERFKQEQSQLKEYQPKLGPHYWKETPPLKGQRIGSCKLWLLTSLKDVQVDSPPNYDSLIWTFGINQILFDQAMLTPTMRNLIYFWGGQEGPKSGNWIAIANTYLEEKKPTFAEFLFIRAILAMAFNDSSTAVFDAKYTYWVPRPHMRNPQIVQIINCPKHPSYPSAHSVTGATCTTILSYFFPNEKEKWQKILFECVSSRIWGGLHYMYDNEAGLIQGEKVGKMALKRLSNQEDSQN